MSLNLLKNKKNIVELLLLILIIFISELYFFRNYLELDRLIGDYADGRLINLICEHWFRFFSNKTALSDLPVFYPAKHILGYSDLLFGFALPYSLFRFCGADMFMSAKFAVIFIHAIGTLFYYYFLRFKLSFSKPACIAALILFSLSSAFSVQIYHVQLQWLSQLPLLLLFLFNFLQSRQLPDKRKIWAVLFILSLGMIFLTSFYIGMFLLVFIFLSFVFSCFAGFVPDALKVLKKINFSVGEIVLYIVSGLAWVLPFLYIYYPPLNFFGVRKWEAIVSANPAWFDIINSSPHNLLWGRLMYAINPFILLKPDAQELCSGFALITFLFGLFACFYVFRGKFFSGNNNFSELFCKKTSFIFCGAFILSLITVVQIGGYTLWYFFFKYFPGCSAIRVLSRYLLFLTFPLSFFCAFVLNDFFKRVSMRTFMLLFICLLFVDNIFAIGKDLQFAPDCYYTWSRKAMNDFLASVPAPPADCQVFYIKNDYERADVRFRHLDAWMIADKYGIKTINGYSGQYPRTLYLAEINSRTYLRSMRRWIVIQGLTNVYSYDYNNKIWNDFTSDKLFEAYTPGTEIKADTISVSLFESIMLNGWLAGDPSVFTSQADCAEMFFAMPVKLEKIKITFSVSSKTSEKLLLLVNGRNMGEFELSKNINTYSVSVPLKTATGTGGLLVCFCNPLVSVEEGVYIYKPSNSWSFFLHSIKIDEFF